MEELIFETEELSNKYKTITLKIIGKINRKNVWKLEENILKLQKKNFQNIILIFSYIKEINSSGIGILLKLVDKFQEEGGKIIFVDVPPRIIALFDVLGLLPTLEIYNKKIEAIESLL